MKKEIFMEFINVVMVFIGLVAIFAGAYEYTKKTVVGRNVRASTPEQIRRFSVYDAFTYIGEGVLVILLAFSDYIPFMNSEVASITVTVLIGVLLVFNYVMAKKLLNSFPKDGK